MLFDIIPLLLPDLAALCFSLPTVSGKPRRMRKVRIAESLAVVHLAQADFDIPYPSGGIPLVAAEKFFLLFGRKSFVFLWSQL